MPEWGNDCSDLAELLLWESQDPNLHRERLRIEGESGEYPRVRHQARTSGGSIPPTHPSYFPF